MIGHLCSSKAGVTFSADLKDQNCFAAQCDARYGARKKIGHDAPLSAQTRTYAKGNLITAVGFNDQGTAESVTYSKALGAEMSTEEQEGFLAENKERQ